VLPCRRVFFAADELLETRERHPAQVLQRALELAEVHALIIRHGEQGSRRARAVPRAGHRAFKQASPRPVVARRAGRRARQSLQLGAREASRASAAPVVLVARHRAQRARARAHRAHVAPVKPLKDVALALQRQALERHDGPLAARP